MSPPIKPQPVKAVTVTEGRKEHLWKRHKDGGYGEFFQPPPKPPFLKSIHLLYVLKGLPHMFRAVYTIVNDDDHGGPIVRFGGLATTRNPMRCSVTRRRSRRT